MDPNERVATVTGRKDDLAQEEASPGRMPGRTVVDRREHDHSGGAA